LMARRWSAAARSLTGEGPPVRFGRWQGRRTFDARAREPNQGAGKRERRRSRASRGSSDIEWSRPTDGALGLGFEGEWIPGSAVSARASLEGGRGPIARFLALISAVFRTIQLRWPTE